MGMPYKLQNIIKRIKSVIKSEVIMFSNFYVILLILFFNYSQLVRIINYNTMAYSYIEYGNSLPKKAYAILHTLEI